MKYIGKRRTIIMGTEMMTDCEAIKYKLLKNEELILFKEESNTLYVIRITPLHSPLEETTDRVFTSESCLYNRLREWTKYNLIDGLFTNQVNVQLRTKDMYYTFGVDVCIEKLEQSEEFEFTRFSEDSEVNMNYLKSFSVFK